MLRKIKTLFVLIVMLAMIFPAQVGVRSVEAVAGPVSFTILHTNDFHGNLELSGSNPGAARMATIIKNVRAAKGAENVLLFDAGDEMQGSLLSNLKKGEPTIATYNAIGYQAATFGNHEFDWGQTVLADRVTQAAYPYISSNIVVKGTGGDCSGWTSPSFATPYTIVEVGAVDKKVKIGVLGVTTQETPTITIASATDGLCFKDPVESISHYYADLKAQVDVMVVLSHLGYEDGGYGYGISVYGDKSLAKKLNDASKPVDLIIGGHSHTNLSGVAATVGNTKVVQSYYAGRQVGQMDFVFDFMTKTITSMTWTSNAVSPTATAEDPDIKALIGTYTSDPDYQALINLPIGYTSGPLVRNYNGDGSMGKFVNDAIYDDLNKDDRTDNDVDMVFNNPGGLRADISCAAYPCLMTYGMLFSVLPFGNATAIGDMTGAQIMELLNQSALLTKGAIQIAGLRFKFYNYTTDGSAPPAKTYAWGAYDACVMNKTTHACDPLDMKKVYKIATNEFLAPAGQDSFVAFKYVKNITYWGDMLDIVDRAVAKFYGTSETAYNANVDGRITRDGGDATGSGTIIPLTILHHNDSHGNLLPSGSYPGYTQLVTAIKAERAKNPSRTILLNGGDSLQGDSMMYYFKTAPLGYASDGTPITDTTMQINPFIKAMNAVGYDAMTLGNHEFNFGSQFFTSTLKQAVFPLLMANVTDTGTYGLAEANIKPYVKETVDGIKIAILGIGNHRVPNYELPSNIPGLSFQDPIATARTIVPELRGTLAHDTDVVVALTHIGFTTNPSSVEVDSNVDTYLADQVGGIDAIIGSHSHTDPSKKTSASGDYQYLPAIVAGPDNTPVIVSQAYRYNNYLGEVILGLRAKPSGGYEVVTKAGKYIAIKSTDVEDAETKAIFTPYFTMLTAYNNTVLGSTSVPLDALQAFTTETNAANMQADASVAELASHGITVDFHLSGAMSNKKVADAATPGTPYTLKVSDMFGLMPYENSLVVLSMNGPQLKAVLERAYRNYYYYKYVPGYGGYSYYTTCMIDINSGGNIKYWDTYPSLPNGNNVMSLTFNGNTVDFKDASTYYEVSTVNYLAAGSCNFNNNGVSLWPLSQISHDTQYYVRDAVINYVKAQPSVISPAIEGRLTFINPISFFLPLVSR